MRCNLMADTLRSKRGTLMRLRSLSLRQVAAAVMEALVVLVEGPVRAGAAVAIMAVRSKCPFNGQCGNEVC